MITDVNMGSTLLNKEEVIAKLKEVASRYPKGGIFSPDEVYSLIPINQCGSRIEFIEYLHSIQNDLKGLIISYRGNRGSANNYGNCTGLALD